MSSVLVTGGLGYVGSRVCPLLLERGHHVRVFDLALYGDHGYQYLERHPAWEGDWKNRYEWVKGDLRSPGAVREAVQDIDAILHLAAISNDPTGEIDDTLTRQVNFDAVGMLLALSREAGVKRFINASSSSVFGIKEESDVEETLEPEPLTSYSRYKMLSEWLLVAASSPDFCTANIRPATICGVSPRQRFDLTVNKLTADAVTKRVITVHGGQQRRPNVGMTDIVNLYANLMETDPARINGRTFNFGFENQKVSEIAEIIQAELKDLGVRIDVTETFDQRDYHICSRKILQELDYKPVSSIRHEVAELRKAIESGQYRAIDSAEYYNMQTMEMERNAGSYAFLSH